VDDERRGRDRRAITLTFARGDHQRTGGHARQRQPHSQKRRQLLNGEPDPVGPVGDGHRDLAAKPKRRLEQEHRTEDPRQARVDLVSRAQTEVGSRRRDENERRRAIRMPRRKAKRDNAAE
jgi:hypothetical protein